MEPGAVIYKEYRLDDLKADGPEGRIEGLASVFGNIDLHGDRIMAGAFDASLTELGGKVKMFMRHTDPIGVFDSVTATQKALKVSGVPLQDVQAGREGLALARAGALDALSVGIRVTKERFVRDKGDRNEVREILEAELFEVSLVPFGANPKARVTAVKARTRDVDWGPVLESVQMLRVKCTKEMTRE